ncbi:methyltransferase domain-containing protein [Rhizobium jaguaris]|uniref:class I SAM-dependent methyltransferase n=1 Tax=Rhizobium jaguaris TaxID=1312183 RepID=UPI0039BF94A3
MLGFSRHGVMEPPSRKSTVAFVLLAKLFLIVGVLILVQLGAGYQGVGIRVAVFHGIVLVAIVAFLFKDQARHRSLVRGGMQRVGDQAGGIVLHGAAGYDLLARVLTFGREGRFRGLMLRLAALGPGETVLDVACGTGTLAIAAKRRVGAKGSVTGIDASAEMIERAQRKADRAGLEVTFVNGTAQQLPFGDGQFDIVMGTLMLHHLPKPVRAAFACEARRVLKPGGRLLLIDFGKPLQSRWPQAHRHGHVDMQAIAKVLTESGFEISDTGAVGTKNLNFIRAKPERAQPLVLSDEKDGCA